jgi:hypothetical protein
VHDTTSGPGHGPAAGTGNPAHPAAQVLCAHLHDRDHIHHLWMAAVILMINVTMTVGVPSLAIQLLVTVGLFGRDALTIMLS